MCVRKMARHKGYFRSAEIGIFAVGYRQKKVDYYESDH